jgi:hypothetical protein
MRTSRHLNFPQEIYRTGLTIFSFSVLNPLKPEVGEGEGDRVRREMEGELCERYHLLWGKQKDVRV